ncbi:hypothetical protein [Streptomyces sp. SCL15-4]|nr:hypothetical protein [Streptomyces sp. SCL15-4]
MDDEVITEQRPVAFPKVFGYLRYAAAARPATPLSSTASPNTADSTN